MIRKIAWLSAMIATLAVVVGIGYAIEPGGTAPARYLVTMHYGGFGPADRLELGTGMSDNLFHGSASAQLELVGNRLSVHGSYADLRDAILPEVAYGIHIHHDPALYHLDTIVAGLQNDGQNHGSFGGDVYLTSEQQLMLAQGRLYMDVHTAAFPQGELRGMILPVEEPAPMKAVSPYFR
ncbi:MAG TPA: CHRD domain-containing protein [Trueperaceae bacterium]|nr:CHRD domain-containing protein [Trueperaceae bacterium]